MGAAEGIVAAHDPAVLSVNGGHIDYQSMGKVIV